MTESSTPDAGKRKPRAAKTAPIAAGSAGPARAAPPPPPPPPPPVAPAAPAKTGRGLKIALALSLGLNLLVLGIVGGAIAKSRGFDGPMMARDFAFGPFTEALTREQRRNLLLGMGFTREGGGRAMREEMRRDFDAVLAALRAEPFDRDKLAAAVAQQNDRLTARVAQGRAALVAIVAEMTPEERERYVNDLQRSAPPRRGGEGGKP